MGSPGTFQTALSSALTQQKCPFSGPTGGKSAQHRGSQPEENQHIDLNQPNPGLMSKSREVKPHGTEVGQNWVRYPQTDLGTPGCKGTPEPQPTCAIAHGRCRDTLRSWQQPEERKSCQIPPSHFKTSCSFRSKYGWNLKNLGRAWRYHKPPSKRRTTTTVR